MGEESAEDVRGASPGIRRGIFLVREDLDSEFEYEARVYITKQLPHLERRGEDC